MKGASIEEVRKQFAFQLLFRRMFSEDNGRWIVLGGNALLLRTGGGRFTQDVDLARAEGWESDDELRAEFQEILTRDVGDPFSFVIDRFTSHDRSDPYGYGSKTATAHLTVFLGPKVFEWFTIDFTVRRHVTGPVDYLALNPVIDHEVLGDLPKVPVVPIENQIADKVCALYEKHNGPTAWSTRYRDLADIVRIVLDLEIDGARLKTMLRYECSRRRIHELPRALCAPHESWISEYPAAARRFTGFPAAFHDLDQSLSCAGRCLNTVLDGTLAEGVWDPSAQRWRENPRTRVQALGRSLFR
ncbi:nucleotidyl transferase AbiEii/AbiGii toxin family protein [Devriesea agamarum]|uniref:nucleotidyl transferase AbiEii/AbiGii toxin family protein n=1 Tax=Devriesea agamarum TaxID=472569 RepID=UPI00071D3F5C|nr:nucleotidyl transferase AbiEii/AbiGii toxin family protein [Devriesea agamarum]